jgi:hypothetical protein
VSASANCGRAVAHVQSSYVPRGDIDLANAIAAANSLPIASDALAGMAASDAGNSLSIAETAMSGISDLEGQQDITGQTAPLRVAGIHVEHAVHDGWAGSLHRTPTCRNAIHCGVVARRVEGPKQLCMAR